MTRSIGRRVALQCNRDINVCHMTKKVESRRAEQAKPPTRDFPASLPSVIPRILPLQEPRGQWQGLNCLGGTEAGCPSSQSFTCLLVLLTLTPPTPPPHEALFSPTRVLGPLGLVFWIDARRGRRTILFAAMYILPSVRLPNVHLDRFVDQRKPSRAPLQQ
jgi:hypothetical protein